MDVILDILDPKGTRQNTLCDKDDGDGDGEGEGEGEGEEEEKEEILLRSCKQPLLLAHVGVGI